MAALADLEPAPERFGDTLADGGTDSDEAFLHHPHRIEELEQFVGVEPDRAR